MMDGESILWDGDCGQQVGGGGTTEDQFQTSRLLGD